MQRVIFLRRIATRIGQNRLLASRVVWQELGDVEYLLINDDPNVVFRNLVDRVLPPVLGVDVAAPELVTFTVSGCAPSCLATPATRPAAREITSPKFCKK